MIIIIIFKIALLHRPICLFPLLLAMFCEKLLIKHSSHNIYEKTVIQSHNLVVTILNHISAALENKQ